MRKNKFGAVKTVIDGITFASKKEAERYKISALLESQGKIDNLRLQPRFPLMVNGVKIGYYVADFQYDLSGKANYRRRKVQGNTDSCVSNQEKILKTYDPLVEITEIY